MQEECMTLQKEKEALMNDLIVCQDMIHGKAQAHPQQQKQFLEQIRPFPPAKSLLFCSEPERGWGASVGETPLGCDGGRPLHTEMGVAEGREDGRSLRQMLDSKGPRDGARTVGESEFGLGQPAGSALGSDPRIGASDASASRVHKSAAKREPFVQACGQSVFGMNQKVQFG